ncbi:hypothetical protein AVEN_81505-1 [Araneus ventricosus]|uniref:Uncharacterized protein n=1 Tax=Araneus ventricosus TaxID=182803 RepID=A0A4Y2E1B0_ARAVE|nr:hypothetical protein AVEN_81505-1 [Araneus ventricosus]
MFGLVDRDRQAEPLLNINIKYLGKEAQLSCTRVEFKKEIENLTSLPLERLYIFNMEENISHALGVEEIFDGIKIEVIVKKKKIRLEDIVKKLETETNFETDELNCIEEMIEEYERSEPAPVKQNMWYLLDDTLEQFSIAVHNHTRSWTGRAELVWPQRSPDRNPLSFSVLKLIKSRVYEVLVEDLKTQLFAAAANITNTIGNFEIQSFLRFCLLYSHVWTQLRTTPLNSFCL